MPKRPTPFLLSPGRYARRLDEYRAEVTCGVCGTSITVERGDGQPMSAADMGNAMAEGFDHDCA